MTETRVFGFICHIPMPQQRCAEGLKTWFLWALLHLFQYLPNSSPFLFQYDCPIVVAFEIVYKRVKSVQTLSLGFFDFCPRVA